MGRATRKTQRGQVVVKRSDFHQRIARTKDDGAFVETSVTVSSISKMLEGRELECKEEGRLLLLSALWGDLTRDLRELEVVCRRSCDRFDAMDITNRFRRVFDMLEGGKV